MENYIIKSKHKVTGVIQVLKSTPSVLDVKSLVEGFQFALGSEYEIFTEMEA